MERSTFNNALFFGGALVLAIAPAHWLWRTWTDINWNSNGALIALLVAALFAWSLSSPRKGRCLRARRRAMVLLGATAVTRLAGQVLGVNMIGALALAVDVYALGLLGGLAQRNRAVSPGWLALLFVLALPIERVIQRLIGFALQQVSAAGACAVLSLAPGEVHCEGIRILINGLDVLVDLPCSGARGFLLLLTAFCTLAALRRPSWRAALLGALVVTFSAMLLNVLRISVLAILLAWPPLGIDVMAAPWHEAIGLFCLAVAMTPLLIWAWKLPTLDNEPIWVSGLFRPERQAPAFGVLPALIFVVMALVIVSLPATPVDVSRNVKTVELPAMIAGFTVRPALLSAQEQTYFTQYGGAASRAAYGPYGLLLVSTSAPLRHLHAPDECLAGAGHRVRYVGVDHAQIPSAIYRSVDPEGRVWRVAVTFLSDDGELASSVGQAVWRWLHTPEHNWTMVQRITPWEASGIEADAWDLAVAQALDLPRSTDKPRVMHLVQQITDI